MTISGFQYLRPASLDEALAAQGLKASGYRLLGYNSPFILPWRQTHELQALLR